MTAAAQAVAGQGAQVSPWRRVRRVLRPNARGLWFAARDQLAYRGAYLWRAVFMAVVLFIKNALWGAILEVPGEIAGFGLVEIIWYLVFTETIELSRGSGMQQVAADVRDGTVAYGLVRPYAYPVFVTSRLMGQSLIFLVLVTAVGIGAAWLITGAAPAGLARDIVPGTVLLLGGVLLHALWLVAFGLLASWFERVEAFRMVYRKLVFIAGGTFIPVDLLPGGVQQVAANLPFAYQAYWPARMLVLPDASLHSRALIGQAVYLIALALVVAVLFALGRRRVHGNGG